MIPSTDFKTNLQRIQAARGVTKAAGPAPVAKATTRPTRPATRPAIKPPTVTKEQVDQDLAKAAQGRHPHEYFKLQAQRFLGKLP